MMVEIHAVYLPLTCPQLARPREALERAETLVGVNSQSAPNLFLLGTALHATGQYRQAAQHLETAFEIDERQPDPVYLFTLAMTYQRLGRKNDALTMYRRGMNRVEEAYPRDPRRLIVADEAARVLGVRGPERALAPTT